jgi:PLAT/LH2 domain
MRSRVPKVIGAAVVIAMLSGTQPVAAETSKDSRLARVIYYQIQVRTGTPSGAGTDANVWISMGGSLNGRRTSSGVLELETRYNDFERDSVDAFGFQLNELGVIDRICLRRDDAGLGDEWNVSFVSVWPRGAGGYVAPFNGWMPQDTWICRRASPA